MNVKACPLSLDSRRSCSGIEFQDAGPVTAKARRCVVAERQKGTLRSKLVEERSTRLEPTDDQMQSSRRYIGPAPTTLFQTRQHVLKVRRSGTGNQCIRCLWSPTIRVRTSVFAGVDGLQCWEPSEAGSVVASLFRPGQRCSNLSWSERTREPVWQPLRRSDADGWVATDEGDRTPSDRCFQHAMTWSAPRPEWLQGQSPNPGTRLPEIWQKGVDDQFSGAGSGFLVYCSGGNFDQS